MKTRPTPTTQPPQPKTLDRETYYPAFKANDARFDGRIFVGVSSTGIYCRPVCRAKMPKKENCTFYVSSAAAEAAGYRPCLLCRPELAPGLAPVDASPRLARRAALSMEENFPCENNLQELSAALGVTDRHLRRVFEAEFGVSPVQYLQTNRLLLAKSLLTDTGLPVTEIAFAAGFGSVRRFNALFRAHYRMTPSALRKESAPSAGDGDGITLYLGYRPPYPWNDVLAFLAARAIPGVEAVSDGTYRRTAALSQDEKIYHGWISVRHDERGRIKKTRNALAVTLSRTLLPVLPKALARIKHLFDLQCDPAEIYAKLGVMNDIRDGLCAPGTRLPGCFDPFEMAVRAVLGQQITVKAARTLAGRIAAVYGTALAAPACGLTHTFPAAADFCAMGDSIQERLGVLGVTGARSRSIRALASAVSSGEIELTRSGDLDAQMKKILALPGFGPWTVQYIAMRALGWPDAFPHTDYGVKKALEGQTPKEILALSEQWSPWRAYATINLWNSLR